MCIQRIAAIPVETEPLPGNYSLLLVTPYYFRNPLEAAEEQGYLVCQVYQEIPVGGVRLPVVAYHDSRAAGAGAVSQIVWDEAAIAEYPE